MAKSPVPINFNKHWGSLAKWYFKLAEQGFEFLKKQLLAVPTMKNPSNKY